MEKKTSKTTKLYCSGTAKKNHLIVQNKYRYDIKEGQDLSELKIPISFEQVLRTEKVI